MLLWKSWFDIFQKRFDICTKGEFARCYYRTEAALMSLERSGMVLKDTVWQTKTLVSKQCKSTSVGYLLHVLHVVQRNTLVAIEINL